MDRITRRVDAREGYDRWSRTYDATHSGLISLDRRETLPRLGPQSGERILDAGCGTGVYVSALLGVGAWAVGLDLSIGMLGVAREHGPELPLILGDLDRPWPLAAASFDAVLSTLVSEHLQELDRWFGEAFRVLRPGGRLVFSAFHPEQAAAGVEANFAVDGIEYRLGARLHSVEDYLSGIEGAGFVAIRRWEFPSDEALVREVPSAAKRLGEKLLLLIVAQRPTDSFR